jgi:hypothetical protein
MLFGAALLVMIAATGYRTLNDGSANGASVRADSTAKPRHAGTNTPTASPGASMRASRHLAAQPLPPEGAPLVGIYATLKAHADAGDATAASRLYRDVQRCWAAQQAERVVTRVSNLLANPSGEAGVTHMQGREWRVEMLSDLRAFAQRSAGRCAGATRAQLDSLVPVMYRAAQLGDVHAIDCYAGAGFDQMPGLVNHPEWLADMRDNVPRMFDYAVRQGDWIAVEQMHHAYAGLFRDTPAGQTIQPDPAMDYRFLRLERLGATGAFVQKLDRMLADTGSGLTPQQIADSDAWAQDEYSSYFAGSSSNEVSNGANICGNMDD